MESQLKINQSAEVVEVRAEAGEGGGWKVFVGDREYQVECQRTGPHQLFFRVDGRQVEAHVLQDKSGTQVLLGGVVHQLEDVARRKAQTAGHAARITPPMPGTLMRILVEVGQAVEEGQEVFVLSAMKMETTLYAPKAAVVKAILVQEGEQVTPGQELIQWEEAAPSNGEVNE